MKKSIEVSEGGMIKLTRWMVKRYLPGWSIYRTRPPVAGRKRRSKEEIQEDTISLENTLGNIQRTIPGAMPAIVLVEGNSPINHDALISVLAGAPSINPYAQTAAVEGK